MTFHKIEFSEAVKNVTISIDSVSLTGTLSQDSKSWIGTLSVNNLQTIGSGDKYLSIEAKDLTDQKLDGNPQSIAQYNPNTSQKENYEDENGSGNSGGKDTLHRDFFDHIYFFLYPEYSRFAKNSCALNNRQIVENSYVS